MTKSNLAPQGPQRIFDPRMIRLHQARAGGTDTPFLWAEAAQGMTDRLSPVTRHFAEGLCIGPHSPLLTPFADSWHSAGFDDAETLQDSPPAQIAVSLMNLHRINDLPGALTQIRKTLKPGGLFLAAMFGGQTLYELREALEAGDAATGRTPAQRVAPFADVQALGNLLKRTGFSDAVADSERTCVHYRDLSTLFADVRAMGESGNLAVRTPLSRTALAAAMAHYAAHHQTADGKYAATFDIVYLTGWAWETVSAKIS